MCAPLKTFDLFPIAERLTAAESAVVNNYAYRGALVVVDISAFGGGTSVTFTLEGYDELSGKYYPLLASAAKTATGTFTMVVHPGSTAVANAVTNLPLPKAFRIKAAVAGTFTELTYSAGATLIP